jgi:glycine cleavage system aminomethyltransferase T
MTAQSQAQVDAMRTTSEGYFTVRWGLPEYTDWLDESMSWKEACYIGDWSFLWERRFRGPDVLKLFSDISVNSFAKFAIGQSKHVVHPTEAGKIIHEGILTRLSEEEVVLFGRGTFWADYVLRHGDYNASSESKDSFNFQVAGPNALFVCEKAAGRNLRDIKFMHTADIEIAGHKIWALRQGMAGEIGYELQGPAEYASDVYNAVVEAGQEFGIRKLGGRAAMINHLEACFPTIVTDYLPAIFGDDMAAYLDTFRSAMPAFASTFNIAGSFEAGDVSAWYRSPVELGWGKSIKFDHKFLGDEALAEELENPRRLIRTLIWNAEDVLDVHASLYQKGEPYTFMEMPRDQRGSMWADKVVSGDELVGVATSRGYSHYFREMLSLATMDVEYSEPGTEVSVIWGKPDGPQREIRATVARAPYKQDNRRVDVANLQPRHG